MTYLLKTSEEGFYVGSTHSILDKLDKKQEEVRVDLNDPLIKDALGIFKEYVKSLKEEK